MKNIVEGKIVDVKHREIFEGAVVIEDGRIIDIRHQATQATGYIIPGFVDAHVHIESSMLTPQNFGHFILSRGTVAIVTDPHEIANVMGTKGIDMMMQSSQHSPVKMFFTIPSCVPSTPFDVAGDVVSPEDVEQLAASGRFVALSEMMNVPGVVYKDKDVIAKLQIASQHHLPIDGHSPRLSGDDLHTYVSYGINTDHECLSSDEAEEKVAAGMKILIREGSAARNYEALKPLIAKHPDMVMFCTDDAHPDDIIERGHIDKLVRMAVADGFDLFDVLHIASTAAIEHYKLDVGHLQIGDKADFIVVNDLKSFRTDSVFIDGVKQYDRTDCQMSEKHAKTSNIDFNNFHHDHINIEALHKPVHGATTVIELIPNELVTRPYNYTPEQATDNLECDASDDIAKIVYVNRYINGAPQVAFCKGFGLKRGAFASSVAHDTHNIIAVGCSDSELANAINTLIAHRGGLVACDGQDVKVLPLPIGGIMSADSGEEVAAQYQSLNQMLQSMGCTLKAPFMTLAFMSLVVIPEIKIGEKGLFSYSKFDWISPSDAAPLQ
jgi:adenine deaminase